MKAKHIVERYGRELASGDQESMKSAAMEVLKVLIREANETVRQRGCKSDAELKTVLCAMDAKADLIVSESYRIYGRPKLAIIKGWFYKTVSREREAGTIVFTPRQA